MKQLLHILLIIIAISATPEASAFDYIGKDPEPKDAQLFGLLVTEAAPSAAFRGPFRAPTCGGQFIGNGFIVADAQGRVWQFTCRHVLDHWSKTVAGADIAGYRLNAPVTNPPKIGRYREGYNVTVCSWVIDGNVAQWHTSDARSRKVPKYRSDDLAKDFARIYGGLKITPPSLSKIRIAEVSRIGGTPVFGPGCSGSPVWQNGAIVGVLVVGPDGQSLVSNGVYFELIEEPE